MAFLDRLRKRIYLAMMIAALASCGGTGTEGLVLYVDAEFDPVPIANVFSNIAEGTPAVAQTYTTLSSGKLEEFWVVVTQGPSADEGTIRVEVRPVDAFGVPNLDSSSAIVSVTIDTSTLPPALVEEFTMINLDGLPNREVVGGEMYAIVVEFESRATSTDALGIATVFGLTGDLYADGAGYTGMSNPGGSFATVGNDYLFRTFVLR